MVRKVDATAGFSIVGGPPDDNGVAPSGQMGVLQISDSPYVANSRIPGTDKMPDGVGFADGLAQASMMLGDDDYDDDGIIVVQGQEDYDQPVEILGMAKQSWIDLGRRCYESGRTFYETGYQSQHIDNSYQFKSQHAPGSKYCDQHYGNRSKIFRPQTRMAARSWEADVASALFMNNDYMNVSNEDQNDEQASLSASVVMEMMNLRLKKNWYKICMGAAQDTFINGPVCSKVYWKQEIAQIPSQQPIVDPMNPDAVMGMTTTFTTRRTVNEPTIDLILPENLLIDPTADWVDPINSAGYVVYRRQMSVDAVKQMMANEEWQEYNDQQILSTRWALEDDAVNRAKRGEGKPDPNDNDSGDRAYESVMILEVIVRRNGLDYVYDMLGYSFLLSDPVPLEVRYAHGRRPFTLGTAMIESHNVMPDSKTQISSSLQSAINEISNNRVDNVKLGMNKRVLVRRGATVDIKSLTRSVPGGVVLTGDPTKDVQPMDISDVTQGSYQETEQLTTEMNELTGTFSAQAVANNRDMNETVGGMEMLSSAATKVVDYDIRTFVNTWVEPTLTLYMLNIQYYEDDELIMAKAVGQSDVFPRLKPEDLTDDLLTKQLMLTVDVGLGATNPQQRVNTLLMGVGQAAQLPGMEGTMDGPAVAKRIFAMIGMDGSQFFPNLAKNYQAPPAQPPAPDPLVLAAQEEAKGRMQQEQIKQEGENARHQQDLEMQRMTMQMKLESDNRIKMMQMALESEMAGKDIEATTWWKLLENETKLQIASATDQTKRDTVAVQQGSSLRQEAINATAQIAQQQTSPQEQLNDEQKSTPR